MKKNVKEVKNDKYIFFASSTFFFHMHSALDSLTPTRTLRKETDIYIEHSESNAHDCIL